MNICKTIPITRRDNEIKAKVFSVNMLAIEKIKETNKIQQVKDLMFLTL
jgi:hypothetical protein